MAPAPLGATPPRLSSKTSFDALSLSRSEHSDENSEPTAELVDTTSCSFPRGSPETSDPWVLISLLSAPMSPPDSVPKAPAALSAYSVFFGVVAEGAADGADAVDLAPSASAFSLAFLALRSAFF